MSDVYRFFDIHSQMRTFISFWSFENIDFLSSLLQDCSQVVEAVTRHLVLPALSTASALYSLSFGQPLAEATRERHEL